MLMSEILDAKILIADDQPANVMLLERILGDKGYTHVSSTTDSSAVCALHEAQRYDLILLDLQMPAPNGFEVMEQIRAIEGDGYLPVLVITAQPDQKLRALQAGARDFIGKPFDLAEVHTRIRNMLEVRLLYRKLDLYSHELEQVVLERTAQLRASEARYRALTELASDWYWEQDQEGMFTKTSGPVFEMLGIDPITRQPTEDGAAQPRWDPQERARLAANIAGRQPFLDFVYRRARDDGSIQYLQVSGEPIFDAASRFIGYRGIGLDVTARMTPPPAQLPDTGPVAVATH
jgi:PAS domain S-box-containing protein